MWLNRTLIWLTARRVSMGALHGGVMAISWWLAYQMRFDFAVPLKEQPGVWRDFACALPVKLLVFFLLRQFSEMPAYFSVMDLKRLFWACSGSTAALFAAWHLVPGWFSPPRGVLVADFFFTIAWVGFLRIGFRVLPDLVTRRESSKPAVRRVGIIGAGDAGAKLARELAGKRNLGMLPVVFFDDDPAKWRSRVHDIPVAGPPEILLEPGNLRLAEVIIAMPSAPARRIAEVVKVLQKARLKFETVPSLDQLATGQVRVSQLRNVEIQDLLGREPVALEMDNIRDILEGRVVMVTGAGGSIGSELCRQIVGFNPQRLVLVEQSEAQISAVEQDLIGLGGRGVVHPVVADILDRDRMRSLFERFQPDVVFHAAAHKHVPMMESQPGEAIKNNTFGTRTVAELALEHDVDRFVLISTDKAINPTNVMGASKRLAEILIQSLHAANPGRTKFMAVRFGNVLGSSGSVIPIFKQQIAAGGPVKVTHPDVTRYFMTIPEAAGLVLQSAAQGDGGEIFVLDMGQPVKIVDLARQLIELSGLRPEEDIEIEYVGLRPGEKLFEELSHHGENIAETQHPKIMRFVCQPRPLNEVTEYLDRLCGMIDDAEANELKMLLREAVPEYKPFLGGPRPIDSSVGAIAAITAAAG